MSRARRIVAVIAGVTALALLATWWVLTGRQQSTTADPAPNTTPPSTTSPSAGAASGSASAGSSASGGSSMGAGQPTGQTSASPQPSGAASPAPPAGCSTDFSRMTPTRATVGDLVRDTPVLSLGVAKDGSVATPPFSQPNSIGWYNLGPRPGDVTGKVVLTAHTFRNGGALGNAMHASKDGLRPGDVIRISDASGRTLCYRYTTSTKIAVKDYDPDSTVLYDAKGRHQLAIVTCWDFDARREHWDSRIIYYAEPITA
ncbi:class F sortase [Luteococcus sp.]|uniref:class F sortase n=1 Tax=Luteococcus sp. TaxID=1969402 RepID=UPI0037363934